MECSEYINEYEVFYKKLWGGRAPLKVKAFVWKLAQNPIPSLINLVERKVIVQSTLCSGCGKEDETASHIFFRCEVYGWVWQELGVGKTR